MEIVEVARLKEVKFMALLHGLVQNKPGIEVSVFLAYDDQMICLLDKMVNIAIYR